MKFSTRSQLNDPFEQNPYYEYNESRAIEVFCETTFEDFKLNIECTNLLKNKSALEAEWYEHEKIKKDLENNQIEKHIPLLKEYWKLLTQKFPELIDKTFITLSLTEDPLNIPMWSHYANNHEGFVIGFETENQFFFEQFNDSLIYRNLTQVKYSNKRLRIKDSYNMDELKNIFYYKSIEWAYEKEWRILRRLEEAIKVNYLYFISFPPSIIKEIYFGLNSEIEDKKSIIKIIESNDKFQGIDYFQIELNEKEFKLIPQKLTLKNGLTNKELKKLN